MDMHLNSVQPSASQYEVSVVEYGEPCVGSLLALVRDSGREQHSEQSSMIVPTMPSSFYNHHNHESCLVSAVPILQSSLCEGEIKLESDTAGGHFLIDDDDDDQQHFVLHAQTIASDIIKSEVFSNLAEQHEFRRKETSLMLGAPLESSFPPRPKAQMLISLQEPEVDRPEPANSFNEDDAKANIVAHPHYPRLVAAYMDCQKVGAPPEVVARLDGLSQQYQLAPQHPLTLRIGLNPELDQFMEAYCEILIKFRDELRKPLNESLAFFKKIETQLNILSKETIRVSVPGEEKVEETGESSEDEDGMSGVEADMIQHHHQQSEIDRELKERLLRKYSGYLSSLKQEFLKKKKKGKLPKEARQKLLEWWNVHYKWPYPSEAEKVGLAECTGLDQKQINNWFINQRKRHWKPSEDMQFVLMDCPNPQNAAFYVSGHLNSDVPVFPLGR